MYPPWRDSNCPWSDMTPGARGASIHLHTVSDVPPPPAGQEAGLGRQLQIMGTIVSPPGNALNCSGLAALLLSLAPLVCLGEGIGVRSQLEIRCALSAEHRDRRGQGASEQTHTLGPCYSPLCLLPPQPALLTPPPGPPFLPKTLPFLSLEFSISAGGW